MARFSETHPRPWRRDSVHGPGARRPLSAEERRIWRARVAAAERAGDLTPAQEKVALALVGCLGPDGRLDPGHATLAALSGKSERTVRRALQRLADLGLLTWERRVLRADWRAVQTTNAYLLAFGEARPPARCWPAPRTGGQPGREDSPLLIQKGPVDLLVARRMAMEARWRGARAM